MATVVSRLRFSREAAKKLSERCASLNWQRSRPDLVTFDQKIQNNVRLFSAAPDAKQLSSPKLQELFGEIKEMKEEDVSILGTIVLQMLGRKIFPGEFGRGLEGMEFVEALPIEEEVEEVKTIFDVKLTGFDAKAKIKVIKEVRAIAGLGLKEAKELVESAPKVIGKGLKQDKADELKAQLEAVGAQIEIE